MPFMSKAQIRLFGAKTASGEISQDKFKQWRDETPNISRLPERKRKTVKDYGKK